MLLVFILVGCGNDEEPGTSVIEWNNKDLRAEQFVRAMLNGDYTIAAEGFNDDMANAFSVADFKAGWRNTIRAAGRFISISGIEFIEHEGYEIYDVLTEHSTRNVNTRVVFDEDGLVAGLFFNFP